MAERARRTTRPSEQPLSVQLHVGDQVRLVSRAGEAATAWKRIASLSESFATFEDTHPAPVSRRVLEDGILSARIEHVPACPRCGTASTEPWVAIRKGHLSEAQGLPILGPGPNGSEGLFDVGYRCGSCDHEWGFEIFTDDYLEATDDLQPEVDRESR